MTYKELLDSSEPPPWNAPGFFFTEGRYYLGMWFIDIPTNENHIFGNDTALLAWRPDDWPPNEWVLTFRHSYKNSSNLGDTADKKNWNVVKVTNATKEQIKQRNDAWVEEATRGAEVIFRPVAPAKWYYWDIDGDENKVKQLMLDDTKRPAWFHVTKVMKVDKK